MVTNIRSRSESHTSGECDVSDTGTNGSGPAWCASINSVAAMAIQQNRTRPNNPVHPRDYPIFRPYAEECPEELLGVIPSEEFDLDCIRIMKHDQAIIAAYRFSKSSTFIYRIHSLVVKPAYRKKGLGKWLLAHLLGIVESKGGLVVLSRVHRNSSFCEQHGFIENSSGELEFTIVPE